MPSATTLAQGCSKGPIVTIQETNVVTPLRPKAKGTDNTSALRQRRSRAKRNRVIRAPHAPIAQLEKRSKIKADVTVATARQHVADVRPVPALACVPWSVWPLAGTATAIPPTDLG
jgi:hypothetical protein